ncbi:MAG TPA: LysE family transporter, partial [Candidatus Didemnitutus sp.]|nr:LysE family transporter [Candidatus Didemnitutus sp.]
MFLKGLILGFSIAAPVGPIGLLCIQRTLARGRVHGFVSGLGAATADTLYGLVAALGLSAVIQFLTDFQSWLQLGGGAFLVWLGWQTLRSAGQTRVAATADADASLLHAFSTVFALTLANPATIALFFAVFAALGIGTAQDKSSALLLVTGVFLGSATWWLMLS